MEGLTEGLWRPVDDGPEFTVILLKSNRELRDRYRATLEKRDDEMIVLRSVARKRLEFERLTIERGDMIRQYFPLNEWFYIQEYSDRRGRVKGWYCNIGTPPVVKDSTLTTTDLILDIFVDTDYNYLLIDENELNEKRREITQPTLRRVNEAKEKLIQMIKSRKPPFHETDRESC